MVKAGALALLLVFGATCTGAPQPGPPQPEAVPVAPTSQESPASAAPPLPVVAPTPTGTTPRQPAAGSPTAPRAATPPPPHGAALAEGFIDTHSHLWTQRGCEFSKAADAAVAKMASLGIRKTVMLNPPASAPTCEDGVYAAIARTYPDRLAFLGGGGTLNPMLHDAARSGQLTADIRHRFEEQVSEILRLGAVGFGELAALHLSLRDGHPYEATPPDHPLLLLLADIAARADAPIDLHMEAVPVELALAQLPRPLQSPPNPATLAPNIAALERLLAHNRSARIVWAHLGWDNTGARDVPLTRRLLQAHPNLHMSFKLDVDGRLPNRPIDRLGEIRPEWLDLIRSFPDRFVIGADLFYTSADEPAREPAGNFPLPGQFLRRLPPELARMVGWDNAMRIYRLR